MRLIFNQRFGILLGLILSTDSISGVAFATDEIETGGASGVARPSASATTSARIVTSLRLEHGKIETIDRSIKLYKRDITCDGAEIARQRACSISMFEAE
jgi:hypothetical protein